MKATTRAALPPGAYRPVVHIANYRAVDPGSSWGPRRIPDAELILIVRGAFLYRDAAGARALGAGDILCIPPGVEHVFSHVPGPAVDEPFFSCIHFEMAPGSWRRGDYAPDSPPPRVTSVGEAVTEWAALFRRCHEAFAGYSPHREALASAALWEILLRLDEHRLGVHPRQQTPRLRRMLAFLDEHAARGRVTRRELARAFRLTPEYVDALFRRELKTTPTDYVRRVQMLRGCAWLMDEGLSVKEAAARLGFCDAFYFSKVFKRVMGHAPGHIRRAFRARPPAAG